MSVPGKSNHPHILMLPPEALQEDPHRTRTHDEKQLHILAGSIERFGFVSPIIVDENNVIIAGHAKWLAAKMLGLTHVPCIRVQFVTSC
ncbi:MAG: ParB/Srx family N-terminal domain-containing protein [Sphingorhabdus sp.]